MPSFISCGLAVIQVSIGASALHRDDCARRMEAYRRPDCHVPALIDTGADTTVVDLGILEYLCLPSYDTRKVEGFDGASQDCPVYNVLLKVVTKSGAVLFEDSNFEVVGVRQNSAHYKAILGMDILHKFTLRFHRDTDFVEILPTTIESYTTRL